MTERNILCRMLDSYAQLVIDIAAKRTEAEAERARHRKPGDNAIEPLPVSARRPGVDAITRQPRSDG